LTVTVPASLPPNEWLDVAVSSDTGKDLLAVPATARLAYSAEAG
jgi:hypothetical protein